MNQTKLNHYKRYFQTLVITVYLVVTMYYLLMHFLGDPTTSPMKYFWTWDMFPGYTTESRKTFIVGKTQQGKYVQLVPGPENQFLGGANGDLSRVDLDLRGSFLKKLTNQSLQKYQELHADDPVTYLYVFQHYWAPRYNLPDALFNEISQYDVTNHTGKNPRKKYWRIAAEATVSEGKVRW